MVNLLSSLLPGSQFHCVGIGYSLERPTSSVVSGKPQKTSLVKLGYPIKLKPYLLSLMVYILRQIVSNYQLQYC